MNIPQIEAVGQLREQRAALLAQVGTAAQAAQLAERRWMELSASVYPGDPGVDDDGNKIIVNVGSIAAVWPEAEEANQQLITGLGDSVPRVLAALAEMQAAASALQAAGQAMDPPLNLLGR